MARLTVKVVGMADRMKGTSKKTGNPYDLVECAFSYVNQWGNNAVACAMIDGDMVDELRVAVGCQYRASVTQVNGKTYIDLIDEVF